MTKSNRKGFTLVELLIVIVVIGVLSAMMMLSSTEAVSSARASNVVSNLRNIKTAVLSWYADNLNRVVKNSSGHYQIETDGTPQDFKAFIKDHKSEVKKYLSNEASIKLWSKEEKSSIADGDYVLIDVDWKKWYVCYKVGSDANIKAKLAARAGTIGLVGASDVDQTPGTSNYDKQNVVCMLILSLEN